MSITAYNSPFFALRDHPYCAMLAYVLWLSHSTIVQEVPDERPKQVMVRLTEAEVAALGVLTGNSSREEWIRAQIRGAVTRRLMINEAAIAQFLQIAREASMRAEDALLCGQAEETADAKRVEGDQRLALIAEYEADKEVIRVRCHGGRVR